MGKENFEGRLNYIKENFGLSDEVVFQIGEIGKKLNTHKYSVWIAKEIKKDPSLINQFDEIQLIIDWAKNTRADIFRFSISEAKKAQEDWHRENFHKLDLKELNIPNLDNDRIIFRCLDQEHFFYLLIDEDLDYEGKIMKHCVATYKNAVNNERSYIISLRDSKNQPHVTIEVITVNSGGNKYGEVVQVRGKANTTPSKKYMRLIHQWCLYVSGYEKIKQDKDILDLLNFSL